MPIYAYRCTACGKAKDVLQKVSDPVLTTCPFCGAEAFAKQVTAAGFQLKGSGWYVTDFKGGNGSKSAIVDKSGDSASPAASTTDGKPAGAKTEPAKSADAKTGGDASASPATPGS